MRSAFLLKNRSDQELLEGVWAAVTRECEDVATVIAHLAEIDQRKLFAEEGCSSLKSYCMEVLHLSEDQAYLRIDVARIARKYPVVLEMLADGLVHVTAVHRLGPSLTQENHRSILAEATQKSMAEVEELVARLRPKPPVPSRIRKGSRANQGPRLGEVENGLFGAEASAAEGPDAEAPDAHVRPSRNQESALSPLSPESYRIEFTGDAETVYALRQLQELLSHQVPNGSLAVIIKDALLLRLAHVKRARFGDGHRRRRRKVEPSAEEMPGERTPSRHIPSEVRRTVWERDQGRCAFVARHGRRCSERRWIELHHVVPFAWGGESTIENIELRCRTHNAYEGELIFGRVVRRRMKGALPAPTGFKTSAIKGGEERARGRG